MKLDPNEIYHLYNRGNNRQAIFFEEDNYRYFLEKVRVYLLPYCEFLAYSLMPNHFHFLIQADDRTVIPYRKGSKIYDDQKRNPVELTLFAWGLQRMLSSYARSINKRFNRTGSLFQQNTKSKKTSSDVFSEDYALKCFSYIHNNAVAAGLVSDPKDYIYSSYNDYLNNDKGSICNIELGRKLLCLDQNEMFLTTCDERLNQIPYRFSTGLVSV